MSVTAVRAKPDRRRGRRERVVCPPVPPSYAPEVRGILDALDGYLASIATRDMRAHHLALDEFVVARTAKSRAAYATQAPQCAAAALGIRLLGERLAAVG